ncbi:MULTISPECIES: mersacidin/lichenicidin family type 2 lantibiotic [Streptomyces violaceusniger group]|uniref:Mersacidin/lichenicidin family type 2 lantibiotic n=1 Tax=Streptomyces rhizosphaericus TaxID=114699 RepID=A0A6G4AEB5_9ACTN|nr:mersacidin/lichenicidin family type 2 lantibiotic [Streptomyces rhizosphaericus]MBI0378998.1 mersacidin/lichenicidin family type 2 lantibiotic [Streptomyces albiflaviniger]NEW71693.1 mersacidin/lichenicidin family type 2 lantibiotic [Streptomyces rhizosphaericus]
MDIVRAWKDPEYRDTLAAAPDHPSGSHGLARLEMSELASAAGAGTESTLTVGCCASPKTFTLTSPIFCTITLSICP